MLIRRRKLTTWSRTRTGRHQRDRKAVCRVLLQPVRLGRAFSPCLRYRSMDCGLTLPLYLWVALATGSPLREYPVQVLRLFLRPAAPLLRSSPFVSCQSPLTRSLRPQRDHSMLSFEAQQFQGAASIVEKLAGLPFTTIKHQISTMDAQPAATDKASMIVLVTGQLLVSRVALETVLRSRNGTPLTLSPLFADWRRVEPAHVLPGLPPDAGERQLLRVSIPVTLCFS